MRWFWRAVFVGTTVLLVLGYFTKRPSFLREVPVLGNASPIQPPSISSPIGRRRTFAGYPCTNDCSGHEAGYEWAEENNISDPDDCDGNSESFIEGCRAYAEEQQEDLGDD